MNYYELLEEKAKLGMDTLIDYLKQDRNLIWTIIDTDEDEIEIQIETWDNDNYNTEFLCSYEFNSISGKLL